MVSFQLPSRLSIAPVNRAGDSSVNCSTLIGPPVLPTRNDRVPSKWFALNAASPTLIPPLWLSGLGDRLETGGGARPQAAPAARRGAPASARTGPLDGVEAQPGDDHEGMAGVRVDRHPATAPGLAPALERGRVELTVHQPGRGERERHRSRAVVRRVDPRLVALDAAVAAAVAVRRACHLVGGADDRRDLRRRA